MNLQSECLFDLFKPLDLILLSRMENQRWTTGTFKNWYRDLGELISF